MYHKQLVNHVATKLNEGVPREKIEEELVNDGWLKDDIKEAFYYSAYPEKLRHFSFIRILHSEVPAVIALAFIILIIMVFSISFSFFKNTTLSYSINLPTVSKINETTLTYGIHTCPIPEKCLSSFLFIL